MLTLYELGYLAVGKSSVFIVAMIAIMSNSGCIVLYFLLVGDLTKQMAAALFPAWAGTFLVTKWFWIVLFGIILLPICLSKVVNEFKGMAYFLAASLLLFVMFFIQELNKVGPIQQEED